MRWIPLVIACFLAPLAVRAEAPAAQRGAELLLPFKRDLKAALEAGLAEGPPRAVGACRTEAPRIAAGLSREGVRVGRSSHKLRNPANAPSEWVKPILLAYVESPKERAPRSVALGDGRAGYVEPILVQPLCLGCHGEVLAPGVAERLVELYPEDEAVGFRTGDFRGVFWVEFPVDSTSP